MFTSEFLQATPHNLNYIGIIPYTYTDVHVHIHTDIYIYTHSHACIHTCTHKCTCTLTCAHMLVHAHMCLQAFAHMHMYMLRRTHIRMHTPHTHAYKSHAHTLLDISLLSGFWCLSFWKLLHKEQKEEYFSIKVNNYIK